MEQPFPLLVLSLRLENQLEVCHALFLPDITRVGTRRGGHARILAESWRPRLSRADPLELARLIPPEGHEPLQAVVPLSPPGHDPAWREGLELNFPGLLFQRAGYQVAYLADLGIHVAAPTLEDLRACLPHHVLAELLRRGAGRSLQELAFLQRTQRMTCGSVETRLRRPSLRQKLRRAQGEEPARPRSVLKEAATELGGGPLPPAYERTPQVAHLAELLGGAPGQQARSVLLVGPSGVGKTAVYQELARRKAEFRLPATPFYETSASRLMAGQHAFGMWQKRCQDLVAEASRLRAVVHLGNLLELVMVGRHETIPFGMAGFFRPALLRGELLAVSECTPEQLAALERDQPQLLEAFAHLALEEPSPEQAHSILLQVAADLTRSSAESEHQRGAGLVAAVGADSRRGPGRESQPGADPRRSQEAVRSPASEAARAPAGLDREALLTLDRLHRRYATASAYPGRPLRFLKNLLARLPGPTPSQVAEAFSRETGLPRVLLDDEERLDLEATRLWFRQRVLGQPQAVDRVVDRLAAVKAGLTRPARPIGSFMLIGPTGVGKTELARCLAEFLYGERQRLLRFDMSEYSDPGSVQRLIGQPWSTRNGVLTGRVREQPFSVVLFDELEKAHPDFFDLLLQVLGEGRLTDAAGRLATFTNSFILMTSNLGAQQFQKGPLGLRRSASDPGEDFTRAVRQAFRPELFNRLDAVIPFAPLDPATILGIARRELESVRQRSGLLERDVRLEIPDGAVEHLARAGWDPRYGARPLKRAVERLLLAPLACHLNRHESELPLQVNLEVQAEQLQVRVAGRGSLEEARRGSSRALEEAEAVGRLGRRVRQLERGPLTLALRNQLALARPGKKPAPPAPGEGLLRQLRGLRGQSEQLELDSLRSLRSLTPSGQASTRLELEGRFRELMLNLYARTFPESDQVTLGIFSELPQLVLRLARCYLAAAAGYRVRLQTVSVRRGEPLPDPSTARPELERVEEPHPAAFLKRGQAGLLGLLLRLEGPRAYPRLLGEGGTHHFVSAPGERARPCLVDVSHAPLESGLADRPFHPPAYQPPPGIHRKGLLPSGTVRRTYDLVEQRALDPRTHPGKSLSFKDGLEELVGRLIEERLLQAAASAAGVEG